ncbi:MAG: hypothetical protein ACYCO4_03345 [Sulfobacillus sp.]
MAQSAKPPTVAGAWLKVGAASIRPGAKVTLTGYVPGAEPATSSARSQSFANLCFGGCSGGLSESAVPIHWSTTVKNEFTMTLIVPVTSWLTPSGPQPLENGTYRVSVQCVALSRGCASRPGEASTVVHLIGVIYKPCPKTSCGQIVLSTTTAIPGTLIQFHGWAPTSPMGFYDLVMIPGKLASRFTSTTANSAGKIHSLGTQVASISPSLNGTFSGSVRVPALLNGTQAVTAGAYTLALQGSFLKGTFRQVTFAPTSLQVHANQTWASLGQLKPIRSTWSASIMAPSVAALAQAPNRIVACVTGQILLSTDGGQRWTHVPYGAVITAAAKTAYPLALFPSDPQSSPCISSMLDPSHPNTIYATFAAESAQYKSIPPIFTVGYVTTNLGQTWQPITPPHGYTLGQFAGFQTSGTSTLALFDGFSSQGKMLPPAVLKTTDGGMTWTTSQLTCPAQGPCLRFGPAPAETGGMGAGYPQPLELSANGGSTWQSPAWPSQVILNQGPSELVALSSSRALLLSGASQYILRLTTDGGQSWQNIALPPEPNYQNGAAGLTDAVILPNGSLLAEDPNTQSWILLPARQSAWCAVTAMPTGFVSPPIVVGSRLWYVSGSANGSQEAVSSTPLSAIRCGG